VEVFGSAEVSAAAKALLLYTALYKETYSLCNIFALDACLPSTGWTMSTEGLILYLVLLSMFLYKQYQEIKNID